MEWVGHCENVPYVECTVRGLDLPVELMTQLYENGRLYSCHLSPWPLTEGTAVDSLSWYFGILVYGTEPAMFPVMSVCMCTQMYICGEC